MSARFQWPWNVKESKITLYYFLARNINFLPRQLHSDDRAAGRCSACQEIAPHQPAPSQFTLLFMLDLTDKIWPNLDELGVRGCGWWILLHLDRNRKAAASSVPSLNAKLRNTDAGYDCVVHHSQHFMLLFCYIC